MNLFELAVVAAVSDSSKGFTYLLAAKDSGYPMK